MKKIILLLSAACFFLNPAFTETIIITGLINENTTWSIVGSPYIIQTNVTVAAGVTLIIEPGVVVRFYPSCLLVVHGNVIADGQPGSTITFYSESMWDGIDFNHSGIDSPDSTILNYCTISDINNIGIRIQNHDHIRISNSELHDNTVSVGNGIINLLNSNAVIRNNNIYNNGIAGIGDYTGTIYTTYSKASILSNNIHDNGSTHGGGIYCLIDTSLIIGNNIINNEAALYGGGIYLYLSETTVSNNNIQYNSADNLGGGIYLNHSNATILNNDIQYNTATDGGGIDAYGDSSLIKGNLIANNSVTGAGGGINLNNTNNIIINNLMLYNDAEVRGGGMQTSFNSPEYGEFENAIVNNTFAYNVAPLGGGIYSWKSQDIIANNILWNNAESEWGRNTYFPYSGYNALTYELISNDNAVILDTLNIGANGPMFTDPESNDFTLQEGSPLIGSGTPSGNDIGFTGTAPVYTHIVTRTTTNNYNYGKVSPVVEYVLPNSTHKFTCLPASGYGIDTVKLNGIDITADLFEQEGDTVYIVNNVTDIQTLNASFVMVSYHVLASCTGGGTISPAGDTLVDITDTVKYTISVDTGYFLNTLLLNGEDVKDQIIKQDSKYIITLDSVDRDMTLEANFEIAEYRLTVNSEPGGLIVPSGDITVDYWDTTTFIITADEEFVFDSLKIDFVNITEEVTETEAGYSYELTKVFANHELMFYFTYTGEPQTIEDNTTNNLVLYPQPCNEYLIVQSEELHNLFTVRVINMNGKVILEQSQAPSERLDVSILNSGIYILQIITDNEIKSAQFIKK
ncbi:MAG: right-handed parallel beta-helix repeat-containing protein [Bacteroidales bacterium]|nr:right-handed parallel beta-helix repeat-containing protein [Bacteroidales bacterium]